MHNVIEMRIKVPNQTSYLRLIGDIGESLAKEICQSPVYKESFSYKLNLVLTEALSNAAKHASVDAEADMVSIHINISSKFIVIRVYDSGQGFDLNAIPAPSTDTDAVNETGRGIFILKSIMDSVSYKKTKSGNVLIMKKELKCR